MTPLVSIIIPTFDRPHFLKEAIEAALAQTHPNIEVLVFDNGTLDETLAVVEEIARRDSRLIFRRHERNIGMSANFNALAAAARGEFLVAIGDDDRLLPDFVIRLVAEMTPEVNVVFCNHYLIDAGGRRLEDDSRAYNRQYGREMLPAGILALPEAAVWRQSVAMSASLLRTSDMQQLRFREDLNTPDAEFFIRLASLGARFVFVPEYLMEYRVHLGAVTVGGLWSEQLVECLTPMAVRPEVERYKRQFLSPMVVNAVSRCLQQGDMERAKKFLGNKYYPRRRQANGASVYSAALDEDHGFRQTVGSLLQNFCANLPPSVGAPIYRTIRKMGGASFARKHVH